MIDFSGEAAATRRQVHQQTFGDDERVSMLLRRRFAAPLREVWDAVADPERLRSWFLPVHGDFRVGGWFQLEGNAGGRILKCAPPRRLKVLFGSEDSVLEFRLSQCDDTTALELEHSVPLAVAGSGAGALFAGPGWDATLLALDLHLRGEPVVDPIRWQRSEEGQRFSQQMIRSWVAVIGSSGTADGDAIAEALRAASAQWTPDLVGRDPVLSWSGRIVPEQARGERPTADLHVD
ncbi:SRPBCC domain-containing protein [Saccharopolyspora sp. CA-218241]|uniref:SRPBCC domain-containing protein n=1 Tax=Saccharopolyspora sp. CA-218241 TaxID=3240027 RepID=UPI003D950D1D